MNSISKIKSYCEQNSESTFVYLMECESFYKIGITKEPINRLSQIKTGNPMPVRIIGLRSFNVREDARILEQVLHHQYKKFRITGEWFRMPLQSLTELINHFDFRFSPKINSGDIVAKKQITYDWSLNFDELESAFDFEKQLIKR